MNMVAAALLASVVVCVATAAQAGGNRGAPLLAINFCGVSTINNICKDAVNADGCASASCSD